MKFGEQLKIERNKLSLTQEAVAIELYVSRQTISSWETGRTYPDIDSLIALSNLYQISLDQLLKEDNGMVEDIRRRTELRESRLVLGASFIVNLLLLGLLVMNMLEVSGFLIGEKVSIVIVAIMFGNLVSTLYAKNKYLQYSTKGLSSIQKKIKKWSIPLVIMAGVLLLISSQLRFIVPEKISVFVVGIGSGVIFGAIIVWLTQKLLIGFKKTL